jgi:drug/metabolite transporter (DMT)-like permease
MQITQAESKLPFTSLLLIAPFFLWGTAMVAMKGVIPNTTPLFMAGVRLVPAGILILGVALLTQRSQPRGWLAWLWITLFGLIDGTLFQGFLAEGLMRTGAGLGSVMIDSQPLAVALMARFLFAEQVGLWGWLGLSLGILGISLIGLPDAWILGLLQGQVTPLSEALGGHLLQQLFQSGEWLMLLASLSMAVGTVLVRYVCRYADPVVATGWHMILGGVPLFALSSVYEAQQWSHLQRYDWLAMAYSTIFGSAIAYGLFFYFAARGNLTSLSSLTFLTPIFALLFGNLFLSEQLTPVQWSGVGLTLASIYLINQRDVLLQKIKLRPTLDIEIEPSEESVAYLSSSSSPAFDLTVTPSPQASASEPESELLS